MTLLNVSCRAHPNRQPVPSLAHQYRQCAIRTTTIERSIHAYHGQDIIFSNHRSAARQPARDSILFARLTRSNALRVCAMSISHRVFVIEEDRLVGVSQATFKKFYFDNKPVLPQYADKVILIAVVFVD